MVSLRMSGVTYMQGKPSVSARIIAPFRRWRMDRGATEDCTYAQLEVVAPQELMEYLDAVRAE